MSRPVCTDTGCERSVVRYRDGAGYCLFHPDAQPPALDPKTGKPIAATPPPRPKQPAGIEHPAPYRAPGRVHTAPRAHTPAPPADGLCPHCQGDPRPYRHQGRHTQPVRPVEPPPADGLCPVEDCPRPYKHTGPHTHPRSNVPTSERRPGGRRPNPLDQQEAARRYLNGEGIFPLAADLHVGVKALRQALTAQGVELRKRGDVIGDRGPAPTPIDPDECQRLYASGLNTTQIARQLHVKTNRVQNLLRELGVLRPPGGRPPGAAALNAVRLKLTREESAAVRLRAATLGQPINHYLRRLVLADLATTDGPGSDEEDVA